MVDEREKKKLESKYTPSVLLEKEKREGKFIQ
jgi:hypothetical protein